MFGLGTVRFCRRPVQQIVFRRRVATFLRSRSLIANIISGRMVTVVAAAVFTVPVKHLSRRRVVGGTHPAADG